MKILLSTGFLGNSSLAVTLLRKNLAGALSDMGHECFIAGLSVDDFSKEGYKGVQFIKYNPYSVYVKALSRYQEFLKCGGGKAGFILSHPVYALAMFVFGKKRFYRDGDERYTDFIKDFVKEQKIRAVAAVMATNYPYRMTRKLIEKLPADVVKIYYQLDPYGLHLTLGDGREERIKREVGVFSLSDLVVTTPRLKEEYLLHRDYKPFCKKIIRADFPSFAPPPEEGKAAFEFKKGCTNLLFCGNFARGTRSPRQVFDNLSGLFESELKVRIFLLGPRGDSEAEKYIKKYPGYVFAHSFVPHEDAAFTMRSADALINIGNDVANMVPSKIFEYFATGKPILNFQSIPDCPAAVYFDRYPLALTVKSYEKKDNSRQIYRFLKDTKGKTRDKNELKRIYNSATPERTARILSDFCEKAKAGGRDLQ